jgi:hypothetical protein
MFAYFAPPFHDVHIGLVISICLSVRMIQVGNRWTDFGEI